MSVSYFSDTRELYEAEVVRFRKNEEETSCGHSTLDCKKLKENSEGSGNCEDVKDENSLTKGTDEKQQKLSTEEKIEEELVNIITSTFETFCISLREDNRTDGKCTEELENYGEISETQETTSGEKDRKNNCWQCSDEDFSSLKENIVGKVQSLLENRGRSFTLNRTF